MIRSKKPPAGVVKNGSTGGAQQTNQKRRTQPGQQPSIVAESGTRHLNQFGEGQQRREAPTGEISNVPFAMRGQLWGEPTSWKSRAVPEWHRSTDRRLAEQTELCEIPLANPNVAFPPEMKGRYAGTNLLAVGDGDWYHGWSSVEARLNHLTDDEGRTRTLFDPRYLANGAVDRDSIVANGRDPEKIGTVLTGLDQAPADTKALVLSPNRFHVGQVQDLFENPNVTAIYVEKPMATNNAELAALDQMVKAKAKPMYFGDHYLFAAAPLFALMGMNVPFREMVQITSDPSGKLKAAFDSGEPLLKSVVGVSGKANFEGNENLLHQRAWLQDGAEGGGTMLDLQVHLVNVMHMLGFQMESLGSVTRLMRPSGDAPRGSWVAIPDGSTRAEDYAHVSGKMTSGTRFDLEVAQFASKRSDWMMLTGEDGNRLIVDFDTRIVRYEDVQGELLGEAKIEVDPVLLMMDHAMAYFASGDTEPMFYEEQRATLKFIDAAKRWQVPGDDDPQ